MYVFYIYNKGSSGKLQNFGSRRGTGRGFLTVCQTYSMFVLIGCRFQIQSHAHIACGRSSNTNKPFVRQYLYEAKYPYI